MILLPGNMTFMWIFHAMPSFFPCFLLPGAVKAQLSSDADDVSYLKLLIAYFDQSYKLTKTCVCNTYILLILKKLLT